MTGLTADQRTNAVASLLDWYAAMGVDAALEEPAAAWDAAPPDPRAWLRSALVPSDPTAPTGPTGTRDPTPHSPARRPSPTVAPPVGVVGSDQVAADARSAAAGAETLEQLEAAVRSFEGCPLKKTATNTVFADGTSAASVMIIGEAPGAEEDRQGKPFVGPAGRLLDLMLGAIGLKRSESAYITNVLPWRPPGNRQPNASELATCLPFCERHIALMKPRLIIMAGGTAAKALMGTNQGIMRLRGRWTELSVPGVAAPIPAMPLYHPAFLLRQPAAKRDAWRDLVQVKVRLGELGEVE